MGGCFSDTRGGQQAIGEGQRPINEHSEAADLFLKSRGMLGLYTHIELSLSAYKLRDRDILSKSDPMAVVYAKKRDNTLEELGRTEVIMNTLNPVWISKITVMYQFEIVQQLVFRMYDVDTKYHSVPVKALQLDEQDFLGECTCVLSEILTKQSRSLTLDLQVNNFEHKKVKHMGKLTVHAEETIASRKVLEMVFRCSNLPNQEIFSKSDPFLRISRIVESGGSIPLCKTEVVKSNLNPTWRPIILSMQQFVSKDNPLILECFDFNNSGNHALIGKLEISLAALEKLHMEKTSTHFYSPSSQQHHQKISKGQLFVDRISEQVQHSFLDYISSEFQLNFMVAIDFTASNGNPHQHGSLHYIDPSGRLNAYQQAILEVGEVIQFYDSDKRFPTWGFGGRPFNNSVSHCFNLNGSPHEYEVGVEGIMSSYAKALFNVTLAGPTIFGPVINRAAQLASDSLSSDQRKYFVLLIITDGVITDLQETKDAIVKASDLPLSILIVGVGRADFTAMEILDADNGQRLVSSTGRIAARDTVQFVPMKDVSGDHVSVVQSLLEELPGQFLTYMRSRGIKPHLHS
ncbi:hypothetical protein H6P81_002053 [Aristolochia fimbriata]|uniref:Uncharacterized protein n=1 Tax=Aristolochia fimbriata TaxID=158543 RepID=A0AAV7F8M2_ARIFI|nr:hypothetical protein H6P81_002053 [Aristolochia fimbriata]